jgi:cell division protein FtsW (lipid II flippase)
LFFRKSYLSNQQIQARLITLAGVFIVCYSAALTIAPAALRRSWEADYNWGHWLVTGVWLVLFGLAHRFTSRRLENADPYLLPIALALSAWGNLTVWRLDPYFGLRQSLWAILSVAVLIIGLRLPGDLNFLKRYKYMWLTGGLLLTALTIFLGTNPSGIGPRMWLGCCGIYFQPSEPLKVLLIMYLAAYLAGLTSIATTATRTAPPTRRSDSLLPPIAPTLLMTGLALILLLVQRDLGTASIFLFLYAAILYVTTGRKRVLLVAGLALVLAGSLGFALFDVVRLRVEAWFNPWLDPSGRSYQIVQSVLAIANGGVLGRGPGMGFPQVVPIAHSDFIYAAIAEESGLVGALALLFILALFAQRGLRAALRAPDTFRRYLATGLVTYLVAQAVLIIGGNIRLLPLTGVTLPFVSYGGSSMLTAYIALLLLLHISNQAEEEPQPLPRDVSSYLHLAAFLFVGLTAAALVTGWWSFYRGPDLLTRTDNPRRAIADRYVQRGSILDRNNAVISASSGEPGEYDRAISYPPLSSAVGYTHPVYGQAGLEASQDEYLRGLRGNPGLSIWWNHLLYGQPPPGLDVRTSLDLQLQEMVDQALGDRQGAAVLLNPASGEILAMASKPGFDANQLDETWSDLVLDERSPLLNRATLGRYPTGNLEEALFPEGLSAFGLDQPLSLRLPAGDPPADDDSPAALSPLQIALVAGALSNNGLRPVPLLVSAVNTPSAGWVLLPPLGTPVQAISSDTALSRVNSLELPNARSWDHTQVVQPEAGQPVTWFVGGTQPGWSGTPLALTLVLEENDPEAAQEIGRQILTAAAP